MIIERIKRKIEKRMLTTDGNYAHKIGSFVYNSNGRMSR